jgi:hypothetical protein
VALVVHQDEEVMGVAISIRASAMAAAAAGMQDLTHSHGSEILYKGSLADLRHGMMGEIGSIPILMVLHMGREGVLAMEVLVLSAVDLDMATITAGLTISILARVFSSAIRPGYTEQ